MFDQADLRIAPASPGKAARLMAFLGHGKATLYLNLEEANTLCEGAHQTSDAAARALLERGLTRVIITSGANAACVASRTSLITQQPPQVPVSRITGAGDVFMASHMAAERQGHDSRAALASALHFTADYISSETPL